MSSEILKDSGIIAQAESIVEDYARRCLNDALRSQKICRCRICVAYADSWLNWIAGNNDLHREAHVPGKGEGTATKPKPGTSSDATTDGGMPKPC